ncbi:hypothetical protein DYB32_005437 [Aphanomyces invadans]|uniref:Uncharacterized protein n=1 Tax=Aphanomyces invadans TaxID=157072 RepID=A0A3R6VAQ5_9STRA|nr:hypothetical protein DYB32_005437 [Aphanomyces invadans]
MFCFCSDSPSVMVKLRKDCLNTKEFVFAYGCAPHAKYNLCMDIIKNIPGVNIVLKQIVYMKTYVLILYTKTRWGNVFFAAQRASKVKAACAALPGEILNSDLDIDINADLRMLLTDPAYWRGVAAMESLFKTISCCLTYLEGGEATFSAVYACFLAIKYHIKTHDLSLRIISGPLSAATKNRARMGHSKIESGTAILFNSGQLVRRLAPTRNTKFCKWLQQLGADDEGLPVEEEALDEEEDAAADALIEDLTIFTFLTALKA